MSSQDGLPDFVTPEDVERERNALRQIQNALGIDTQDTDVDDTMLAAVVANSARTVQLLRQISGEQISVEPVIEPNIEVIVEELTPRVEFPEDASLDIEGVSIDQGEMQAAFEAALSQQQRGRMLSFPEDGREYSFPAGSGPGNRHNIDLRDGDIQINGVDRTPSLEGSLGPEELATTAHLWADDEIVVRAYNPEGDITGVWTVDGWSVTVDSADMERLELDAERPFEFRAQLSTGPDTPITPQPVAAHQDRFGHITTSDGTQLQTIPFVGTNPADYGESDLPTAADNHGNNDIYGAHTGLHHFIVQNNSANDAEVQARLLDITGEQVAADNDIHGSVSTGTSNVVTVSANDFAFLSSGEVAGLFRLLAQAATDTNQVDLDVQYFGTSPAGTR